MNGGAKLLFKMIWNLEYIFKIVIATKTCNRLLFLELYETCYKPKTEQLSKRNFFLKKIQLFGQKIKNKNTTITFLIFVEYIEEGWGCKFLFILYSMRYVGFEIKPSKRSIFDQISKISKVWMVLSRFKQIAFNNVLNKSCCPIPPLNNIHK